MKEQSKEKRLEKWQDRYDKAKNAYAAEREKMRWREKRARGEHLIRTPDGSISEAKPTHVRNICGEMVEAQVDTAIPQPKVTAKREEDSHLAREIEDLLRNLLDQLPMEVLNDEGERTCPIQGGYYLLVGWLASAMGRGWLGETQVDLLHPMKVVPQPDVYRLRDMDYVFVDESITKEEFRRRYGFLPEEDGEDNPEVRGTEASQNATDEIVSLHTAYFKNDKGGIGRYRWTESQEAEYLEDYQVRRIQRCSQCGEIGNGVHCEHCGSRKFEEELQEYETLTEDLELPDGKIIPAMSQERDEYGQPVWEETGEPWLESGPLDSGLLLPQLQGGGLDGAILSRERRPKMVETRIPYYKPDVFPLVLRKNVSKYDSLLGGSDIDALEDAQNGLNKICTKINTKVLGGGSIITVPRGLHIVTDGDYKTIAVDNPADLEKIRSYNLQVDVGKDLELRAQLYEEGRQAIGVTDSMQGRRDPTATSRVAKEFAAERAQGRLESKRTMKQAAFAELFEILFKFMLAYADEPRPMRSYSEDGEEIYTRFDRHDFLYEDEDGSYKYNDDFLFSCDTAAPLASNRTALWQETRMNYESGAMGNPQDIKTQLRFWELMEKLHYPLASIVKGSLMAEKQDAEEAQTEVPEEMEEMGDAMPDMWT